MNGKFFTPPLRAAERETVFQLLDLGALAYTFVETSGPLILRIKKFEGTHGKVLLRPALVQEWENGEPTVILDHASEELTVRAPLSLVTLWGELFPFPFPVLADAFRPDSHISLRPAEFASSVRDLWQALLDLEGRLSQTELACVWIRGGSGEIPILFHFVRRRLVRIGTGPHLLPLGEKYREGLLGAEGLREYFGTRSSFYYLDVSERTQGNPLQKVACAIQHLLSSPSRAVEAPVQSGFPQDFEL